MEMLVEGKTNKEIGSTLGLKTTSVKSHTSSILSKAGFENRIQLLSYIIDETAKRNL